MIPKRAPVSWSWWGVSDCQYVVVWCQLYDAMMRFCRFCSIGFEVHFDFDAFFVDLLLYALQVYVNLSKWPSSFSITNSIVTSSALNVYLLYYIWFWSSHGLFVDNQLFFKVFMHCDGTTCIGIKVFVFLVGLRFPLIWCRVLFFHFEKVEPFV